MDISQQENEKKNHLQERFLELCVMITKARFKIDMFICTYIYICIYIFESIKENEKKEKKNVNQSYMVRISNINKDMIKKSSQNQELNFTSQNLRHLQNLSIFRNFYRVVVRHLWWTRKSFKIVNQISNS